MAVLFFRKKRKGRLNILKKGETLAATGRITSAFAQGVMLADCELDS